ncbi:MAG: retron system putative HNH endonuclease [Emticicia sp.]|nr:retron system putative HNH endonuclease [Emticicia sp.]
MKYIDKQIKNEPQALRNFRNNTPNANYKGYTDKDIETSETHPLKNALLKEQGYLCAYCMGKISLTLNENNKPKIEVEHFKPQETHSKLDLSYMNMLGVCNGLSITHPEKEEMHHCDKTKGEYGKMNGKVELKKLNPCDKTCETLITYKADGEILAVNEDIDVKYDLENVLNLNNQALKDARKAIVDNARKNLMKEKPTQQWNKVFLQKHLDFWLSINERGEYKSYCMIAVWFIKTLLSKSQYNR